MAVVRQEFRADVVFADRRDPILGSPPCRVPDCDRQQTLRRLCDGHHQRWKRQGRPDMDTFVRTVGPVTGHGPLTECTVVGCGYGVGQHGLCNTHFDRWRRAGRPDRAAWLAGVAVTDTTPRPACELSFCTLWAQPRSPFCRGHMARWHYHGRPDPAAFAERCRTYGAPRFDFRPLGDRPQLRLELQYALQCRSDEHRTPTRHWTVQPVIRVVAGTTVTSLLDWSAERWKQEFPVRGSQHTNGELAFLRYARTRVEDLRDGSGWEAEFPRDIWELRRLGIQRGNAARLRFDRIPQPWLRALSKRWVRWRLTTGISVAQAVVDVLALTRFAAFLNDAAPEITATAELSRELLERFLAALHATGRPAKSRAKDLGSLGSFLTAVRQHRWDPTLPADVVIYHEDYPKDRQDPLPRFLSEQVMAQVEHPNNLDRWPNPAGRLVTLILIRCGLRIGDATRLALDCVIHDGSGAPYLRYFNRKLRREALVPIDHDLEQEITRQRARVAERWPDGGTRFLFPQINANADGSRPFSDSTYRQQLNRWLATCEVRDGNGPVHLTPHQWRHTFATRLMNRDVPQEVVRVLLDHESLSMTAHYGKISDTTVRRRWEQARKVNINGEHVSIDPEGPLADAAWTKHRVGLATQALPNGYCGLPVQQICPHANACLTCPVFITTPEFLDQHHQHRAQTRRLIAAATARGQLRLAEMNQQVLANLDRIITALEADVTPLAASEGGEVADAG
jgi:integrase